MADAGGATVPGAVVARIVREARVCIGPRGTGNGYIARLGAPRQVVEGVVSPVRGVVPLVLKVRYIRVVPGQVVVGVVAYTVGDRRNHGGGNDWGICRTRVA